MELIPDFDSLVEIWIALFGRSESRSVVGVCRQFGSSIGAKELHDEPSLTLLNHACRSTLDLRLSS